MDPGDLEVDLAEKLPQKTQLRTPNVTLPSTDDDWGRYL